MEDIALYIPCFNVERTLGSCLEAVLGQRCARLAEVLVVDDGSHDGTVEIASSFPVRVIRHANNRGLAAARNTGIEAARCELVASIDADCVVAPNWLDLLAGALESDAFAAAGGRLIEAQTQGLANRWRTEHMTQDWGVITLVDPPFMFGNNLLVRKSSVESVGGYDERFKTNGEDADLSSRMYASGLHTLYLPSAEVRHLRSDTISTLLNSVWGGWRFGAQAYFRRSALACARNLLSHFVGRHFTRIILRDIRKGNLALMPLDLMLPFYMVYRDLQLLRGNPGTVPVDAVEAPP